jgi:hypothetical protein
MKDPVRNPYTSPESPESPETAETAETGNSGVGSLTSFARTGLIITFAMIQGLVFMGAILLYLSMNGIAANDSLNWLPALGVAAAVASWFAAGGITTVMRRQAVFQLRPAHSVIRIPERDDAPLSTAAKQFVSRQQTASLVGQALLEGGAMINLILMLIDHSLLLHLVMAVVAIVGIGMLAPTADKLRRSLENAAQSEL